MTNEELVARIQAGETDLMAVLWEQVKRYAYKSANRFYILYCDRCVHMGVELDDLFQEAYEGIHRAAVKFMPEKGFRFLTYAEFHLKARFYPAVRMRSGGRFRNEAKLNDNSAPETLQAADEIQDFIEDDYRRGYLTELRSALQEAIGGLKDTQKETVVACMVQGVSAREYAKRKGVFVSIGIWHKERSIEALESQRTVGRLCHRIKRAPYINALVS